MKRRSKRIAKQAALSAALREGISVDPQLPTSLLAAGRRVRIGALTFKGWIPNHKDLEPGSDAWWDSRMLHEMLLICAPGAVAWFRLGDGYTQEVV